MWSNGYEEETGKQPTGGQAMYAPEAQDKLKTFKVRGRNGKIIKIQAHTQDEAQSIAYNLGEFEK